MRITVDIDLPLGSTADIDIEEVWDHFFFKTPTGTNIKVTKIADDGSEVSFS